MRDDNERARFEVWARSKRMSCALTEAGDYVFQTTYIAWVGWCARGMV